MNNNQGRRRTRRVRQQRKQKNTQISRILLTICMMALVAVVSIGGTVAWLTSTTQTVTNTFAASNITLTLTESKLKSEEQAEHNYANDADYEAHEAGVTNQYKVIPGKVYKKDPKVTISNDVPAYLFVKLEKGGDVDTYFTYKSLLEEPEWTNLKDNIWYRVVPANKQPVSWNLLGGMDDVVTGEGEEVTTVLTLKNGYIQVNGENVMLGDHMTKAAASSLRYTAYAIQKEGFTPETAWEKVSTTTNP